MKHILKFVLGLGAFALFLIIIPNIGSAAQVVLVKVRLISINADTITVRATTGTTSTDTTYKLTATTVFKEKFGGLLPKAQLGLGDYMNVWVESTTANSKVTKVVDLQTWKTSVTGRISDKDDERLTFTQTIPSTIKAIDMTVFQAIAVETDTNTLIRQTEVKKTVSRGITRSVRTGKTRVWADLTDGTNVTIVGYWHRASGTMSATRVQMPDKAI